MKKRNLSRRFNNFLRFWMRDRGWFAHPTFFRYELAGVLPSTTPTIGIAMNNMNLNTKRCNSYGGKAGLAALLVAASMTVASTQALAAEVCFNTPIPVPANGIGIYVNLFNGVAAPTPAGSSGWDFNPYGTAALSFYSPAAPQGHVSSGGVISNLPTGTLVDGSSTYTASASTATAMGTYRAGVTPGYVGVRFAQAGVTYYAWISMTTTGPTGQPSTINSWCFQNTAGVGITVGTTPVSLQKYSVD